MEEAERRIGLVENSGYLETISSDEIGRSAAECKCRFPISIVDYNTLSLAKTYGIRPYSTGWRKNSNRSYTNLNTG